MGLWKKRRSDDFEVDFETLEELFEELIDTFEEEEINFDKPLKLGFSVSLDEKGNLKINEFGLLEEKKPVQKKNEVLLVDTIDYESEVLIVVETNSFPPEDIDVKVLDHAMIITNHKDKKFLKKINFDSKVRPDSINTQFNNGVLEIRLKKKISKPKIAKS
ncbi:MAG TPA: Hsp20/alpha crystallin family protein [archaeon]|nr:Hsp20/alpha crystallin family protein [archaeon]